MTDPRLYPSYDMTPDLLRNSNPEYEKQIEELGKGIAAVRLNPLQAIPAVTERIVERLGNGHHLEGSFTANPPTVYLQIHESLWGVIQRGDLFRIWGWGWPGDFGSSLTFTVAFSATATPCRVSIPGSEKEMLEALRPGRFNAVFFKGPKPFSAYEVDMTAPTAMKALTTHLDHLENPTPRIYADAEAHYWEVVKAQSSFGEALTPEDRLSLSWIRRYNLEAGATRDWLADISKRAPYPLNADGLSPQLTHIYQVIAAADYELGGILRGFNTTLSDVVYNFHGFFDKMDGPLVPGDDWNEYRHLRNQLHSLFLLSSVSSHCGRQLRWLNPTEGTFDALQLAPAEFPEGCDPENCWQHMPNDFQFGWGLALTGADYPVAPDALIDARGSFPRSEDFEATTQAAQQLFEEATYSKRGTIPPGAVVDLSIGPFVEMEIAEVGVNVYVTLRTADGACYLADCEPRKGFCGFSMPQSRGFNESYNVRPEVSDEECASIKAAVTLLLAAIIRDFWVIEERESVFNSEIRSPRRVGQRSQDDRPRIVYLPRVQYTKRQDVEKCVEQLGGQQRKAHSVRPHLRKSQVHSGVQIELAERYGFTVPEGYTFVRPHDRGTNPREKIYRSRSALKSLYVETISSTVQKPNPWFQFERDVNALMAHMDFDVQHISVSRRGDKGVDVYATKGSDLDEVKWIIQCKCWHPSRAVGPSTVREMIGTLHSYPRGVRGMIVTTSRFSSGAMALAFEHNLRLMDGQEVASLIGSFAN